jgi:hypothetical protein
MSSSLQIEANRANGKKSKGPVSVEGKLKSLANSARSTGPVTAGGKASSAQNALRHGILAESVVLTTESQEAFIAILRAHEEEFRPTSYVEHRYVETMTLADWRRQRLLCLEKELFEIELSRQDKAANENLADSDPAAPATASDPASAAVSDNASAAAVDSSAAPDAADTHTEVSALRALALAFRAITDESRVTELISRYESRYDRPYNRALAGLRAHRAEKRLEKVKTRNEVNPTQGKLR